jgi:hypothetical protein
VAKTMELEKMMREFQQTHQERLYSRVWSLTSAMLAVCQKQEQLHSQVPSLEKAAAIPAATEESLMLQAPLANATQVAPSNGIVTVDEGAPTGASILDPETQQLLKKRLQSLGDVVVHASDKFEACCASGRVIPPGALRVRPRRCDHVFLVECLMPYWAEGLCPVCRCSFAYDRPQDAGYDESDRYSSVSTSISQALPRHVHSSSNSDGGAFRGPRALHTIGEGSKESRGRSSSGARRRRGRGPASSHGRSADLLGSPSPDMRSGDGNIATELRRGVSPSVHNRPGSPTRSVASLPSRTSSAPRDKGGPLGQAMSHSGARPL